MKNTVSVEKGYKLMFQEYPDVVDVDAMRAMLGVSEREQLTACCGMESLNVFAWVGFIRYRKSASFHISAKQKSRVDKVIRLEYTVNLC